MDWMTFVTKLVDALAWPVAATVIALHFREQIKLLLGKIRTAKGVGIELSFAHEAEKAAAMAATMNAAVPTPAELPGPPGRPGTSPAVAQFVAPGEEDRPTARVLDSWLQIERAILAVVREKGVYVPENQTRNPAAWLAALKKEKALPPETLELIEALYRLRNQVAHASDFEPDIRAAKYYEVSARKVIDVLSDTARMFGQVL